jgi:hypothetical protein
MIHILFSFCFWFIFLFYSQNYLNYFWKMKRRCVEIFLRETFVSNGKYQKFSYIIFVFAIFENLQLVWYQSIFWPDQTLRFQKTQKKSFLFCIMQYVFFLNYHMCQYLMFLAWRKKSKKVLTDGVIVGLKNLTQDFIFEKKK